jgi:YfiH family protein
MTARFDREGPIASLRFPLLDRFGFLRHAVTTRLGGSSAGPYAQGNLGLSVGDERDAVLANRLSAAALVATPGLQPATLRQVHGVTAFFAEQAGSDGTPLAEGDMLATSVAGVPLMVQSADCLPLLLADPTRRAVAAVHAGWRGTAASAGREAVASMKRLFDSQPGDLFIVVGPGIGACCYEVGEDVADAVARTVPDTGVVSHTRGERPHLDLGAALLAQLRAAGVPAAQIEQARLCTACRTDLFYSHRREGEPTGRFGALIAMTTG